MKSASVRKLVLAALFAALCFVGANLKVAGSIAFDSLPAFLSALLLGPAWGAAVGAVAHLLTAMTSGFPFGPLAHGIIAVMMGATMAVFYWVYTLLKGKTGDVIALVCAAVAAVLVNGPVEVVLLLPVLGPVMGNAALFGLIPVLSIVAAVNVAVAAIIYKLLPAAVKAAVTGKGKEEKTEAPE